MIYTLTLNPALDRELTVPSIAFDEVLRASALRIDWGGKGFNVSRALAAWGEESVALGFVGGPTGQRIAAGLEALGVCTDFVTVSGETRTNISIVDQDHNHYVKVNESGPTITVEEEAALLQKIRRLARADDWWVLSGSLPPGVATTFYADMTRIVQSAGAHVLLDASGAALRHGCEAAPFLAKPNAVEAGELVGQPVASLQDARIVVDPVHTLGVKHLLLSLGKAGALFSDGQQCWLARPPQVEERNPIGAGDAMVAGLVWGLCQAWPWPDVLRWAVASGAAAAGLDGTAVGTHAKVEALTRQVELVAIG